MIDNESGLRQSTNGAMRLKEQEQTKEVAIYTGVDFPLMALCAKQTLRYGKGREMSRDRH